MAAVACYHYPCPDGVFAALAAHLGHQASGKPVRWVPLTVFKEPKVTDLSLSEQDTVYFLDYTGPVGFPEAVARHARQVIVLDHHKTAAESLHGRTDLPSNMTLDIDMQRSGATIALDWFKPPNTSEDLVRKFRYIEDADLWRWALPDSKAFHAGLGSMQLEYDANRNPGIFDALMALTCADIIARGKGVLQEEEVLIQEALGKKLIVQLGGPDGASRGWGRCLAVFTGDTSQPVKLSQLRSRLGNELASCSEAAGLEPIGVVAYTEEGIGDDSKVKVSLRGVGNEVDTTRITQAFGGGGHAKASSCIVDAVAFFGWRVAEAMISETSGAASPDT